MTEAKVNETVADASMPKNVIAALARVQAELPGIGKTSRNEQQGYKYRGIEEITAHAQGLLGKYGVVFTPHVRSRNVERLQVNSKPWTQDELEVTYTVYGPGGVEDKIEVGPIYGLGRDNSDKGSNKAMTQAFKYALIQTLCIGDSKDDADQATHETSSFAIDSAPQQRQPRKKELTALQAEVKRQVGALSQEYQQGYRAWKDEKQFPTVDKLSDDQANEALDWIGLLDDVAGQKGA